MQRARQEQLWRGTDGEHTRPGREGPAGGVWKGRTFRQRATRICILDFTIFSMTCTQHNTESTLRRHRHSVLSTARRAC